MTLCDPGFSPPIALLSDFGLSTWSPTTLTWGLPGNLTGSIFVYRGVSAGSFLATVSTGNAPALVLSGTVAAGDYAGGGMAFDRCVNTTVYTGFTFTLGGTAAGCQVFFQVLTFSQQSVLNRGSCNPSTMTCFVFPKVQVQVGAAPNVVRFSDLANTGLPAAPAAIAAEMLAVQWQVQSAAAGAGPATACSNVNLTIDDVSFITD